MEEAGGVCAHALLLAGCYTSPPTYLRDFGVVIVDAHEMRAVFGAELLVGVPQHRGRVESGPDLDDQQPHGVPVAIITAAVAAAAATAAAAVVAAAVAALIFSAAAAATESVVDKCGVFLPAREEVRLFKPLACDERKKKGEGGNREKKIRTLSDEHTNIAMHAEFTQPHSISPSVRILYLPVAAL